MVDFDEVLRRYEDNQQNRKFIKESLIGNEFEVPTYYLDESCEEGSVTVIKVEGVFEEDFAIDFTYKDPSGDTDDDFVSEMPFRDFIRYAKQI